MQNLNTRKSCEAKVVTVVMGRDGCLHDRLSGEVVRHLMRKHGKTIKGIALKWRLTQKRVRQVRAEGVQGTHFVADWLQILTEQNP